LRYTSKRSDLTLFTALNENGMMVHASDLKANQMLAEQQSKCYCPACGNSVILKRGEKRLPHFAHQKDNYCESSSESESSYHLQGKLQLYERLKNLGMNPELEPYFPAIKQRADIGFIWQNTYIVLEFQCSSIPIASIIKRTQQYKKANYKPVWILGHKHIKLRKGLSRLSAFQASFLTKYKDNYIIPTYCPKEQAFHFLHTIIPISKENIFTSISKLPLDTVTLDGNRDSFYDNFPYSIWKSFIRNQKNQQLHYPTKENDRFLRELYQYGLHPHFLPPFIGIPLKEGIRLATSPLIWQSYLYMDSFLMQGKIISLHKIHRAFLERIKRREVQVRSLPSIIGDYRDAVNNYINVLLKCKEIEEVRPHFYKKVEEAYLSKNNIVTEEDMFFKRMQKGGWL